MSLQYRDLITSDEFQQAVDIQKPIWDMDDREVVPYHVLIAMQYGGGVVLGAFDGDRLIGFSAGFLALREDTLLLWSHITGVLPAYQGRGIGSALKWQQRQAVLARDLDCIGWTYDPLQRGNAAFNLRRLGCVCQHYHADFYGEMRDRLNVGLPSDRFEVRWWLESARVLQRLQSPPPPVDPGNAHRALSMLPDGAPGEINWPDWEALTLVEIPGDINGLKRDSPDLAYRWRMRTREAFTGLFQAGFVAVDVVSYQARHWYVLQRDGGE